MCIKIMYGFLGSLTIPITVTVFVCLLSPFVRAQTDDGKCNPVCTVEQYCLNHGAGITTCNECSEICPGYPREDIGEHSTDPRPTPTFECQEFCSEYLKLFDVDDKPVLNTTEKTIVKEVFITPNGLLGQSMGLDLVVIIAALATPVCLLIFAAYKFFKYFSNKTEGTDVEKVNQNNTKGTSGVSNGNSPDGFTRNGSVTFWSSANGSVTTRLTANGNAPTVHTANGNASTVLTANGTLTNTGLTANGSVTTGITANGNAPTVHTANGTLTNTGPTGNGSVTTGITANGNVPPRQTPNGSLTNGHVSNGHLPSMHREDHRLPNEHLRMEDGLNGRELNEQTRSPDVGSSRVTHNRGGYTGSLEEMERLTAIDENQYQNHSASWGNRGNNVGIKVSQPTDDGKSKDHSAVAI